MERRMADPTTVFFATNRKPDPTKPGRYGAEIVDPTDPGKVLYAVIPVTGVDLSKEASGQLGAIIELSEGDFADSVRAELTTTGRNLLVFIHGFDNSFEDAIKRAAFNREWFAASGMADADTTVLAFTWPSAGETFASLPDLPQDAYLDDQAMAGQSDVHIAAFLHNVLALVARVRASGKRAFLLTHSMGNRALASAIPVFFAAAGANVPATFNEAILAAGDEVHTTLQTANTAMYGLREIADRISAYCSLRDIAMDLSMAVNKNIRLGYSGPADRANTLTYPTAKFRIIDCTEVFDYFGLIPPDATHQYYRRSRTVRADIVKAMAGQPVASGVSSLSALPFGL
jgi:esterase/lipase superfamily enzyme